MAWTECQSGKIQFNNYSNIIKELYDAIDERWNAVRYVLQTYYSTDFTQGDISEHNRWLANHTVPFNNIYDVFANMYLVLHGFTTRSSGAQVTADSTIGVLWCYSPSLSFDIPSIITTISDFTGGVGPWYKLSGYTYGLDPDKVYDSTYSNIEKVLADEIIRYINHMFYFTVRTMVSTHTYTYTMYNFYNGAPSGSSNFVYGENAFVS